MRFADADLDHGVSAWAPADLVRPTEAHESDLCAVGFNKVTVDTLPIRDLQCLQAAIELRDGETYGIAIGSNRVSGDVPVREHGAELGSTEHTRSNADVLAASLKQAKQITFFTRDGPVKDVERCRRAGAEERLCDEDGDHECGGDCHGDDYPSTPGHGARARIRACLARAEIARVDVDRCGCTGGVRMAELGSVGRGGGDLETCSGPSRELAQGGFGTFAVGHDALAPERPHLQLLRGGAREIVAHAPQSITSRRGATLRPLSDMTRG